MTARSKDFFARTAALGRGANSAADVSSALVGLGVDQELIGAESAQLIAITNGVIGSPGADTGVEGTLLIEDSDDDGASDAYATFKTATIVLPTPLAVAFDTVFKLPFDLNGAKRFVRATFTAAVDGTGSFTGTPTGSVMIQMGSLREAPFQGTAPQAYNIDGWGEANFTT